MQDTIPKRLATSFLLFGFLLIMLQMTSLPVIADDEVEEIEVLDDIAVVETASTTENIFLKTLGHLHPAFVHMPIGWLFLLLLLDVTGFLFNKKEFRLVGFYVHAGTLLVCIPALVTGFINVAHNSTDPSFLALAAQHRNLGLIVFTILLITFIMRVVKKNEFIGMMRLVYLGIIGLDFALIGLLGHLGGKMVFGDSYLPF